MSLEKRYAYDLNLDNSSGNLKVSSGAITAGNVQVTNVIATNYTISNFRVRNLTTGNIVTNAVNLGTSTIFSGSAAAFNNTSGSVIGLIFGNTLIRSFVATVTATISKSDNSRLCETFTLEGIQKRTEWTMTSSKFGDDTGLSFSINPSGQIIYTSSNIVNFEGCTIRYNVTQVFKTNVSSQNNTKNVLTLDSITINDTTDAIGTTTGSLFVNGGLSAAENITANGISSGSLTVSGSTNSASWKMSSITSASLFTTNVSFSNLTLTNLTGTNLVSTSITTNTLSVPGTLTFTNLTINNLLQTFGSLSATGNSNTVGSIFTTGGNVGINETQPTSQLTIRDPSLVAVYLDKNNARNSIINSTIGTILGCNLVSDNAGVLSTFNGSGGWSMRMTNSDRFEIHRHTTSTVSNLLMSINSAGSVGFGGDVNPSYKLNVTGEMYINGSLTLDAGTSPYGGLTNSVDAGNLTNTYIAFGPNGTNNDWAYLRQIGGWNSYRMALDVHDDGAEPGFSIRGVTSYVNPNTVTEKVRFSASGQTSLAVHSRTGSVYTDWDGGWLGGLSTWDLCLTSFRGSNTYYRSDRRKKRNIQNYTKGIEELSQLRVVTFYWKPEYKFTDEMNIGFIAQEVEQILPEFIMEDQDGFKILKDFFVPLAVKSIQDLKHDNDNLRSDIDAIKARLNLN